VRGQGDEPVEQDAHRPPRGPLRQCCTHFPCTRHSSVGLRPPTSRANVMKCSQLALLWGRRSHLPGSRSLCVPNCRSRQTRLRRADGSLVKQAIAGFVADDRRRSAPHDDAPQSSLLFHGSNSRRCSPCLRVLPSAGLARLYLDVRVVAKGCNCRRLVMVKAHAELPPLLISISHWWGIVAPAGTAVADSREASNDVHAGPCSPAELQEQFARNAPRRSK